jgi:hypothetical protein
MVLCNYPCIQPSSYMAVSPAGSVSFIRQVLPGAKRSRIGGEGLTVWINMVVFYPKNKPWLVIKKFSLAAIPIKMNMFF